MDLYARALHIIFVVTWFSGLFYIVRLFIYHTEAQQKPGPLKEAFSAQFALMEKRLWYGITWPSAVFTTLFGLHLLSSFWPLSSHGWLMLKLVFVAGLWTYHLWCGSYVKKLKAGQFPLSSTALRILNEVATIFLVAIVFLVVLKDSLDMVYGLLGLFAFSALLMMAIKLYKKVRKT